MHSLYEVALVRLLQVTGSRRPHNEKGMIHMELMGREWGFHIIRITDIEGMAHLIPVEENKL